MVVCKRDFDTNRKFSQIIINKQHCKTIKCKYSNTFQKRKKIKANIFLARSCQPPIFALPKRTRSVGKSVNTPPFHGGMTGSTPVRSTRLKQVPIFKRDWDFYLHQVLKF